MNAKRKVLKTAKQINDPQIGHCEFHPDTNKAWILIDHPSAVQVLEVLFAACGWEVVDSIKKKKRKQRKR